MLPDNFTRFLLLKRTGSHVDVAGHDSSAAAPSQGDDSRPSDFYILDSPSDIATLTQTTPAVRGVHTRPWTSSSIESTDTSVADGSDPALRARIDRYPSKYLVEVAAGEVASIGRYIGRTDLHIAMS